MDHRQKLLLRAAERIRERLLVIRSPSTLPPMPDDPWQRCSELARQYSQALDRGWHRSATIVRDRYRSTFHRLIEQVRENENHFYDSTRGPTPSLRDIYLEITALDQEFDSLRINAKDAHLVVTTDRVVLDEVDLGPFEIRLSWEHIGLRRPYETVAMQPNPACGDEDVTHPHVRSDALCEGDGKVAIDRALCEGRLFDFFSIVNRILHTYSPSSPYVALEQWSGVSCSDCGSTTDQEEVTRCSNCSDNLCLDCRTYCERCECDFCASCVGSCHVCDAALCRDCQISCICCGKRCCSGCVSDSELCEECQNDVESEPEDAPNAACDTDPAPLPASSGATVEESPTTGTSL